MDMETIATHDDDCGIITEIRIIHGQVVVMGGHSVQASTRRSPLSGRSFSA